MGSAAVRIGPTPFPAQRSSKSYQIRVLIVLLARAVFSVSLLCFGCMWCFVSLFWLSVPVQLSA